jgi:D-glycero-D-manno-heptose 1,7-bisphosphate phosphatase
MPLTRKAAFLDRDGTIIVEKHYLANPDDVGLTEGAVTGLLNLMDAGFKLVLVTNQSGIARGLYSEADFHAVQQRLEDLLIEQGIRFDGVYYCPHHPDFSGPCECRKPAPGMYLEAERNLRLDLPNSVFIGDRLKDVLPARPFGARGILVGTGYGAEEAMQAPAWVEKARDLAEAASLVKKRRRP